MLLADFYTNADWRADWFIKKNDGTPLDLTPMTAMDAVVVDPQSKQRILKLDLTNGYIKVVDAPGGHVEIDVPKDAVGGKFNQQEYRFAATWTYDEAGTSRTDQIALTSINVIDGLVS